MFLKHFASKNQLPGFYINGTLFENGLTFDEWYYVPVDHNIADFTARY